MQNESSKLAEHAWKECHDGRYDSAIESFIKALNLDPLDKTVLRGLGWSYYHKGKYDDAIHYFDSTLERNKIIPKGILQDVFRGIGWSYYRKGEFNKGINSFQKAIENIAIDSDGILTDARRGLNLCRQAEGDNGLIDHNFYEALEHNNITLKTPITKLGSPEFIEIELINKCNLQCIMCHVTYEKGKRSIIDRSFVKRLKGLEGRWVTMGATYEPVLHPNFKNIVLELSSMGIKIDLITNGTLLTKEMSDSLADANFRNVTFSFDGMRKKTYESIRHNANFEETLERILYFKNAIKSKETYFAVNYTVLRRNVEEIPEAVEFWDKHGFQHIGFIAMVIRDLTKGLVHESPESIMDRVREKMEESGRLIIKNSLKITISSPVFSNPTKLKKAYPVNFVDNVVKSDNREALVPFNPRTLILNGTYPGMSVNCRVPFKYARIMFNGDVEMCYQFTIGNIHQDDFMDIWQGETVQKLRKKIISTPKICYACDYYRLCVKGGEVDYSESDSFISERINSKYRYPTILEERKSHNIVAWLGDYYALPRWMSKFDVWTVDGTDKSKSIFVDSSLDEVKRSIAIDFRDYGFRRPIIVGDFGSYIIVGYIKSYYGVHRTIPDIHKSILDAHMSLKFKGLLSIGWYAIRFRDVFRGKSENDVKNLIEDDFQKYGYRRPTIIEDFGSYHIVGNKKAFYGVNKSIPDSVNTMKIFYMLRIFWQAFIFEDVFSGKSVSEVKESIEKDSREPGYRRPTPVEDFGSYVIVGYKKRFYGVFKPKIKTIDFPGIWSVAVTFGLVLYGNTIEEVKDKITERTPLLSLFVKLHGPYNIVCHKKVYYGLPNTIEPTLLLSMDPSVFEGAITGKTAEEVEEKIIGHIAKGKTTEETVRRISERIKFENEKHVQV